MEENRKQVNIYTDGACSGNPGPGGWAAILEFGPHRKEISGYIAGTTNNRMELFAAISGLGALKEPCDVKLYSDSNYLVQAFNDHWIDNWKNKGWKTSNVKGHADHPENNRCDELARAAIEEYRKMNEEASE